MGDSDMARWIRRLIAVLPVLSLLVTVAGCDLLSSVTQPALTPVADSLRDGSDIVVAGDFGEAGGLPRTGVVRVSPDGVVDPDFVVTLDNLVATAVPAIRDGVPVIYIGGPFTRVNGVPRTGFAAVDAETGALIEEFNPILGPVGAEAPGAIAVLPVPSRGSVIVGGLFSGVASDPTVGALDISVDALAEVRSADGAGVTTFQPVLQPDLNGTLVVRTLAPGLGELGEWSVVAGGQFLASNDATFGTTYGLGVFDASGAVRAVAPPFTDGNGTIVFNVRTYADRESYGVVGAVPDPAGATVYVQAYFIDAGGLNGFQADPGAPLIDAGNLGTGANPVAMDALRLDGGRVLLAGGDPLVTTTFSGTGSATAAVFESDGSLVPGDYLAYGANNPADPRIMKLARGREWIYAGGRFSELSDALGTVASGPLVRFDENLRLDTAFTVAFALPFESTEPSVWSVVELPPGF